MLADPEQEWTEVEKDFLNELLSRVDDELEYMYYAYRENPASWDYDYIPMVKTVDYHFLMVMDGFEEICRRMKETVTA